MQPIYVVKFEHQLEVMTQNTFKHFLEVCVLHNKDITTFQVWDLSRVPLPLDLVVDTVKVAKRQKIYLSGGAFTNGNEQFLYSD